MLSTRYHGIALDDELGGGLNNGIMNLAQLLHQSCERGTVLVLPKVTSGWRFFRGTQHTRRPFTFGELYNASHFIEHVRPCVAVETMPSPLPSNASFHKLNVVAINAKWPFQFALPRVYAALRPSAQLQAVVDKLLAAASAGAGRRWAGVHLRIEKDWWVTSPFCNRIRYPTQRCFRPSEIAALTRAHRDRRQRSTGSVLFYAAENISPRGPHVELSEFGMRTTKATMPAGLPYTMRAAAEFFLAALAPAGFYGNSYSTFTRGVAMLRRARSRSDTIAGHGPRSFAYDCGALLGETPSSVGGMTYLETVNRSRCSAAHPQRGLLGKAKLKAAEMLSATHSHLHPWQRPPVADRFVASRGGIESGVPQENARLTLGKGRRQPEP